MEEHHLSLNYVELVCRTSKIFSSSGLNMCHYTWHVIFTKNYFDKKKKTYGMNSYFLPHRSS